VAVRTELITQEAKDSSENSTALVTGARHGADSEHRMPLWTALKLYPKAIGWSVLLSSTLIMEGYDLALLGSLYASPAFNQKYGAQEPKTGKWSVSAAWQSGLSNGARAGEIIGLVLAGLVADRFGYKTTVIGSLVLIILFVFVLFFAPDVRTLVVGEVLCGMSYLSCWGCFSGLGTTNPSSSGCHEDRHMLAGTPNP
jgi:MFS transporter, SP family, general alpha glucoside:H+ symporter